MIVSADGSTYEAAGQVEIFDGWKSVLSTDAQEEPEKPEQGRALDDEPDSLHRSNLETSFPSSAWRSSPSPPSLSPPSPKPVSSPSSSVSASVAPAPIQPSCHCCSPADGSLNRRRQLKRSARRNRPTAYPFSSQNQSPSSSQTFLRTAFPSLVDYSFTAAMEDQLDQIDSEKISRLDVSSAWWTRFEQECRPPGASKARAQERPHLRTLSQVPIRGQGRAVTPHQRHQG